nr:uncharacterized protein LOC109767821 [Aegilops tauschii subsp. strangulata]
MAVPTPSPSAGGSSSTTRVADHVEEMMERLRLTAVEASPVVLDDEDEADLVAPDCALVGKVLSPNILHLQTISSAMRPAWGNPRGLLLHPYGDNVFVAEFGSVADRTRVIEGSPWMVGKHAVLLKVFYLNTQPLHVKFDRLAIWARIMNLPPRLRRAKLGLEFAKPIGNIIKVDADSDGRCWGGYMHFRVEISVGEPLVRYVTVTSVKLQSTDTFSVMYERLPLHCFSCGLLGHSSVLCPSPGVRDVNGDLPYAAKRICVQDERHNRAGGSKSSTASSSAGSVGRAGGQRPTPSSRAKAAATMVSEAAEGEVSSPVKRAGRGRGRTPSSRGRGRGRSAATSRELFSGSHDNVGTSGQKRKAAKAKAPLVIYDKASSDANDLALVLATDPQAANAGVEQLGDEDSNKKQRTSDSRSADPAAAAAQPRLTQ